MTEFHKERDLIVRGSILKSLALGIAAGVFLAAVFGAGFWARDALDGTFGRVVQAQPGERFGLLREVQAILDQHYLRPQPSETVRQYGAIRGMLTTLEDPFTFFIDPPVAASEADVLAGTYGGIGVQIQRSETGQLILYPFESSPALAAGVEAGDVLVAVNDQPVDVTLPPDALDQLLRGEVREGSGVTLTLLKDGAEGRLFVPFGVINVPSVVWRALLEAPDVGYLQIQRFTARTPQEVRDAMADLTASGITGLVVDLRANTGGLLQESITVADEFIDTGVLVYERSANGEEAFDAQPGGVAAEIPVVVLVNDRTASGAEILAGAIQDSGRGILIGQKTYGKGTVQLIFPLSDGSSLHVTASEWFTPAYQPLDRVGLEPDIPLTPDPNGRDIELAEAIRVLQR